VTQTSQVTELIKKVAVTLLVIGVWGWIYIQTTTVVGAARRTQQDLDGIAIAAQRFYKQHNRWPRDLLEMRNDRSNPFIGQRDHWRRAYVFLPPSNGKKGRVETYGADGIATGRKGDGDAAVEFDGEEVLVVPLPPSG
jgi:hypothetical protein